MSDELSTITIDTSALTTIERTDLFKSILRQGWTVNQAARPKICPDRVMHGFYYEVTLPTIYANQVKPKP